MSLSRFSIRCTIAIVPFMLITIFYYGSFFFGHLRQSPSPLIAGVSTHLFPGKHYGAAQVTPPFIPFKHGEQESSCKDAGGNKHNLWEVSRTTHLIPPGCLMSSKGSIRYCFQSLPACFFRMFRISLATLQHRQNFQKILF